MTQHHEADILIIGAGLSGLAAAEHLAKAGIRTVLLEARDRIGGRVFSMTDKAVAPVELGAEWFDTQGHLQQLLTISGQAPEAATGDQFLRTAEGWKNEEPEDDFRSLLEALHRSAGPDRALTQALDELAPPQRNPRAETALKNYVRGFHAADPDRLSVQWLLEVERTQSADASQLRSPQGADATAKELLRQCGDRCRIHLACVVEHIQWTFGRVQVDALQQGRPVRFIARKVIITLPLAVLQAKAGEVGAVGFDPPLSSKSEALAQLAMGRVMKVVLVFRTDPCADHPQLKDALFVQDRTRPFPMWWNVKPNGAPVWSGWAGGPLSQETLTLHGDDLRDAALRSFAHAIGSTVDAVHAHLVAWYHHDWVRDPFARGAYSYVLPGGLHAHRSLAAPLERTLYFAGEATCGEGYNATMEGAFLSGRRAAQEVLDGMGVQGG